MAAGKAINNPSIAVSFPTDNSKASQLARIETAIVTLQNLKGPGVGCPAASTTFVAQQKAIQNSNGSPQPPPTAPLSTATPSQTTSSVINPALVPEFGVQPGVNPTGTGDCDGITNSAGQVVKIPCSCPPDRTTFINVSISKVFTKAGNHIVDLFPRRWLPMLLQAKLSITPVLQYRSLPMAQIHPRRHE